MGDSPSSTTPASAARIEQIREWIAKFYSVMGWTLAEPTPEVIPAFLDVEALRKAAPDINDPRVASQIENIAATLERLSSALGVAAQDPVRAQSIYQKGNALFDAVTKGHIPEANFLVAQLAQLVAPTSPIHDVYAAASTKKRTFDSGGGPSVSASNSGPSPVIDPDVDKMTTPPAVVIGDSPRMYLKRLRDHVLSLPGGARYANAFNELHVILDHREDADKPMPQGDRVYFDMLFSESYSDLPQPLRMMLAWWLGNKKMSRGERGVGVKIAPDLTVDGRPPFSEYTKAELPKELVPHNAETHMRHVVAWHNIREGFNSWIVQPPQDARIAELTKLLNDAEAGMPKAVLDEMGRKLDELIKEGTVARDTLGNLSANALVIKALYYMNSNPENLWRGDGPVNSGLPNIFNTTMDALRKVLSGATTLQEIYTRLQTFAATAENETDKTNQTAKIEVARRLMNEMATLKDQMEQSTFAEVCNYLDNKARDILGALEVDLIPSEGVDADDPKVELEQIEWLRNKISASIAAEFNAGRIDPSTDQGRNQLLVMFASLLNYGEIASERPTYQDAKDKAAKRSASQDSSGKA
ncbi:MAG: hypothetical protein AAF183_17880 [Pseudomonadota bacterium]